MVLQSNLEDLFGVNNSPRNATFAYLDFLKYFVCPVQQDHPKFLVGFISQH